MKRPSSSPAPAGRPAREIPALSRPNRLATLLQAICTLALFSAWCQAETAFDLGTARLTLDGQGAVTSLVFSDGQNWPACSQPAFCLQTAQGRLLPESVARVDNKLKVLFAGGSSAEFAVQSNRGFAVFRLVKLSTKEKVTNFRLFSLATSPQAKLSSELNAGLSDSTAVAVMAAEVNVHAYAESFGGERGDKPGCRHEFVQTGEEAKVGRSAARFTATSSAEPDGWSMRGRSFVKPLDLSGCKAIRVWVKGDGQGEALKIQLSDGQGGCRDNYLPIDFEGWRQVTLSDSPYNTLNYRNVAAINFYYNGLPPGKTVTCLIDHVEAIVQRDGREEAVLLEDFETRDSPLWSPPATLLNVETVAKHGLEPACFGLIACPRAEFMDTVMRFEAASGLPSPRPGGKWNKVSPWIKRSYFFLTDFRESQFDEALAIARRGNFHMIILGQESWCHSTGHYEVDRDRFPGGLEGLARTMRRFREAGFRVGLHFLGPSIYPPDPYLLPIPDPRLVRDAFSSLNADIDEKAQFLPTPEAPEAFPAEDGGYKGQGTVLQVGEELIAYGERSTKEPFGFGQCQRGYLGTRPAAHKKGEKVAHLRKSYGYYLFDMDTSLLDEVSTNFAKVANACDVDMIYFDGSELLQGDHWYYNAKLHKAFYDKLKNKDMLLQASSFSHYSWHLLARSASADGHDDLKAYLDERSPWFDSFQRNGMPLDIGWYYGYDTRATPDMYEYVLGATIGYDSSMSFQVSPAAAARHPFTPVILDLIARYEKLRLSGRVTPEMKERLRIDPQLGGQMTAEARDRLLDVRRDYRLVGSEGHETFQRVDYRPWREIASLDGKANVWPVQVKNGPARAGVQFHAMSGPWLHPGPSYQSAEALVLETFDDLAPYSSDPHAKRDVRSLASGQAGSTFPGVTQHVELSDQAAPQGGRHAIYTAESSLATDSGWSVIGRQFDPPLDISWHKAIGFWLRGDGQGGQFKLQLLDGRGAMDYYVANDFTGWRYQQLARPQNDAIDYHKLRSLMFYYNGLPGKTSVACGIDDVKALRGLDTRSIKDPYVEIAGRRFAWKGTLLEGQYVLLWPDEPICRYGLPLSAPEVAAERFPSVELPAGDHRVTFGCSGDLLMPVRVRLTLQPPERHPVSP
jgi:hypothetical protein